MQRVRSCSRCIRLSRLSHAYNLTDVTRLFSAAGTDTSFSIHILKPLSLESATSSGQIMRIRLPTSCLRKSAFCFSSIEVVHNLTRLTYDKISQCFYG